MTHVELMEENRRLKEQLAIANDWGCEDCARYDGEKAQPVVWCYACHQKALDRAAALKERQEELEAEVKRLRAALEPFAALGRLADAWPANEFQYAKTEDCRRAAALVRGGISRE